MQHVCITIKMCWQGVRRADGLAKGLFDSTSGFRLVQTIEFRVSAIEKKSGWFFHCARSRWKENPFTNV